MALARPFDRAPDPFCRPGDECEFRAGAVADAPLEAIVVGCKSQTKLVRPWEPVNDVTWAKIVCDETRHRPAICAAARGPLGPNSERLLPKLLPNSVA